MQDVPRLAAPQIRSIEDLRGRSSSDPEAIKAVAREMESLFAYEMIKAMREASGQPGEAGLGKDTYMSMFDMELSKIFAQRGLGLQDMFVKQLTATAAKAGQGNVTRTTGARSAEKEPSLTAEIRAILPDDSSRRLSSAYGMRQDPFTGDQKFHHGVDIAAPAGTDIHPVRPGKVVFSGEQPGYGNVVIIDHGDGFSSKYAHNKENTVAVGDSVDRGSIIARVGSTGRATGPHVHFEVQYKGEKVPPETLLAKR